MVFFLALFILSALKKYSVLTALFTYKDTFLRLLTAFSSPTKNRRKTMTKQAIGFEAAATHEATTQETTPTHEKVSMGVVREDIDLRALPFLVLFRIKCLPEVMERIRAYFDDLRRFYKPMWTIFSNAIPHRKYDGEAVYERQLRRAQELGLELKTFVRGGERFEGKKYTGENISPGGDQLGFSGVCCGKCRTPVDESATQCHGCGATLKKKSEKHKPLREMNWISADGFLRFLLECGYNFIPEDAHGYYQNKDDQSSFTVFVLPFRRDVKPRQQIEPEVLEMILHLMEIPGYTNAFANLKEHGDSCSVEWNITRGLVSSRTSHRQFVEPDGDFIRFIEAPDVPTEKLSRFENHRERPCVSCGEMSYASRRGTCTFCDAPWALPVVYHNPNAWKMDEGEIKKQHWLEWHRGNLFFHAPNISDQEPEPHCPCCGVEVTNMHFFNPETSSEEKATHCWNCDSPIHFPPDSSEKLEDLEEYECPDCRATFLGEQERCPHCSTVLEWGEEPPQMNCWSCPACLNGFVGHHDQCPHCNTSLSYSNGTVTTEALCFSQHGNEIQIQLEGPKNLEAGILEGLERFLPKKNCPSCHFEVIDGDGECPRCETEYTNCHSCGELVGTMDSHCHNCGEVFLVECEHHPGEFYHPSEQCDRCQEEAEAEITRCPGCDETEAEIGAFCHNCQTEMIECFSCNSVVPHWSMCINCNSTLPEPPSKDSSESN